MWGQMMGAMSGGGGGQSDSSTTAMGTGAPVHNAGIFFGEPSAPTWSSGGPGGVSQINLTQALMIGGVVLVLMMALKGRK